MRVIDLTRHVYGRLLVLDRVGSRYGHALWRLPMRVREHCRGHVAASSLWRREVLRLLESRRLAPHPRAKPHTGIQILDGGKGPL